MLSKILDNLFIGDFQDASRFYFPNEPIQTTIDLSGWDAEKDIKKNNFCVVHKAIFLMEASLVNEAPTLVHCDAGIDRSPFVVACYLNRTMEMQPMEAYEFVKDKRPQTFIHDDWMKKFDIMEEISK